MMMLTDLNGGIRAPPAHLHNTSPAGLSVTPTAASANANANRRPRAHSMHQFGGNDKSLGSPSAARGGGGDCNASGSFVSKLFCMVDSEPSSIVSWTRGGTAFCIVDPKMMAEHCLPKYFRHRRFSSLIRQLNFYSFYRVQEGQLAIYQHSFFRKGRPDLLVHIKRRGAGKAKDPLFDPLASPTSGTNNNNNNKHATKHTNNNQTLNLHVIGTSSNTNPPLHGMMCYSPMSKPVMMENMSPALKPGMAPSASPPPMVDAMGSSIVFTQQQQPPRWEQQQQDNSDHSFALATAAMKHKFVFTDAGVHGFANHSNSSSHSMVPAPLDLDIQDFLTDDCSITNNSHVNAHTHSYPAFSDDRMSNMHAPKHALVSRDLLKWDSTKCVDDDASSASHVAGLLARHDADDHDGSSSTTSTGTFEDELLLDLANVEPDAWEVPLSPLNEDEDMMPWLDLCF